MIKIFFAVIAMTILSSSVFAAKDPTVTITNANYTSPTTVKPDGKYTGTSILSMKVQYKLADGTWATVQNPVATVYPATLTFAFTTAVTIPAGNQIIRVAYNTGTQTVYSAEVAVGP